MNSLFLRSLAAVLLALVVVLNLNGQNGSRMEGFNSSHTNVSRAAGPVAQPEFQTIATNITGSLKRIADDGSLIVGEQRMVASYTRAGQLKWRTNVADTISGAVVDIVVASSGTVYASSATAVIALDSETGLSLWQAPFVANSGNESGRLILGSSGTLYFHTGSASPGGQERLTAINPDGTRKWEYAGNTGRGSSRVVFDTDESTSYIFQFRGEGGFGRAIGLSTDSGGPVFDTSCDVRETIYGYSRATGLLAGAANGNWVNIDTDKRACSVSSSGSIVTDVAAIPNSGPLVVRTSSAGGSSSYAGIYPDGRVAWSRFDSLADGFADTPAGEGSGTFFAVAPETNEIIAIRIATGEEMWRQRFSAPISGLSLSGDGNLYLVAGTNLVRSNSPSATTTNNIPPSRILARATTAGPITFNATSTASLIGAYGFNEGTGSTTADASTNAFSGTLANGAVWTTAGKYGNAISFDGLDDKVVLPSTLDVSALPFTLEAWINPTDFGDWRAFFSKRAAFAANQMRFDAGLEISSGRVYLTTYTSQLTFAYVPPVNTWTHLALVATTTGTSLYVNGALQQSLGVITLGTGSTAPVAIGGSADDDDHFAGTLDDFRLYARALTLAEIQDDMNTPIGVPVLHITQPQTGAAIIGSTVDITYTATGDLSQVDHVQFQLDANPVVMDLTFDGVYQLTGVANGSHVLNGWLVRADNSKIVGSDGSVSFTTSISDTMPPTVSMTAPSNGATVSSTISVAATASDDVGVAGVQFLLDGQVLSTEDTTAPYSVSWNTATASNGSHMLSARARDLAGNLTVSASISVTVANSGSDPAVVGQWSAPAAWPLVSVHLNLLPTGKILAWDNSLDHDTHTNTAVLWDPATGTFTDVSNPAVNLFCAGQTQLADGSVLVVGGHIDNDIGINSVSLFDPFSQTWTAKAPMSYARWYPTATTLPDGRVLALVGTSTCKDCISAVPEVYNPATDSWQQLTAASSSFARYFPHTFVLPDGRLLVSGTSQIANATDVAINSRILDINTQSWTVVDSATRADGLSAMYLPGKVVRIGGSWDDGSGYPSAATSVLDMTASNPTWRPTTPMQFSRVLHNLTILPDGTVLTTGGTTDPSVNPPANSIIYTAELWNPATETWTTLSNMQTPRLYHSTTALLPDGRVLVAGGGRSFTTDELNAEIFSPPYLFKGTRPVITSAPAQATYGTIIFVATPDASRILKVSLVRLTSVTHTTNFNQRYAELTFQQVSGGLNVTLPANANLAPAGYYMLFLVDDNGVPSVSSFLRMTASATDTTPPTAPSALSAVAAGSSQINLNWTAATDNVGVTGYRIERCQGGTCTTFAQIGTSTTVSYSDTGLTASTTYQYRVLASDAAGNLSPYSNIAAATTDPIADTTPPTNPTNLTAIAGGANQLGLAWTASTDNVAVTGYRVERCQGAGCSNFSQIATPSDVTYNDAGLSAATSYSYRVRATDAAGNLSGYSNVASGTTQTTNASLVAAYSFDEGTGTTVADASGNGNTGTIASATWTTAGKYGNTLTFNGTSARVTINDSTSLHLTTGMTLEAWVYPTTVPSGWRDLIYKQNDNYYLEASSNASQPTAGGTFTNGVQNLIGPSALPINTWTHLAVTFDGSNLKLWMNGVAVASQAQTSPLTTSTLPLQIGGDSIYGQGFTGCIDEVRVYNRALSGVEIELDMNTPIGSVSDSTTPTTPSNARGVAGGAPPSIVATQAYINSSNLSTHTTSPFDSTGGDLIVVFGSSHENVSTLTLTDNKSNSWTLVAGPTNHSSSTVDLRSALWYTKPTSVGPNHTVTLSLSTPNALVISVFVIKGSRSTSPLDATSAITDDGGVAGSGITSASINTTQPADLLIDFGKSAVGVTWTAGSGYTFESNASSNYLSAEDAVAAAPGAYTANWSVSPAVNWHNVLTSVVSANATFSNSQITITWGPSTDNVGVTGYVIERCTGAGCSNFAAIGSTAGFSTTTFTDIGLLPQTTYLYRLRAKDAAGNLSGYSNTITTATTATGGTDTTPPTTPTTLTATAAGANQINLTWTASTDNVGVSAYGIQRCQGVGCSSFSQVGTSSTASYSDSGLTSGVSYSYRVLAADAAGNQSAFSNTASATTPDNVAPTVPMGVTATAVTDSHIHLSWTASTDNVGVTAYLVERCQDTGCSSFAQIATPSATTYNDTGLGSGVSYSYRVRARDAAGNMSGYSNVATAVTPTVDVTPPTAPSSLTVFAGGTPASVIARQAYINSTQLPSHTTSPFDSTGGSLIVVLASSHESVATLSISDNKGNTWITAAGPTNHSSAPVDLRTQLWYATSPNVGTAHTVTISLSTSHSLVISVLVIKGSNVTSPVDVVSPITDDGGVANSTITSAPVLTMLQGDLLVDFAKVSVGVTWTAGANYTFEPAASSDYLAGEDALAGAPGSYSASWTTDNAFNWQNVLVGLKSANATLSSSQVTMTWSPSTDNVGVTGYQVERCVGAGCSTFAVIGSTAGATTIYTDATVSASTSYTYRVRATDAAGNLSPYSVTGSATTTSADTVAPTAPTNLAASPFSPTQINLTWTASTDNVGVSGYVIQRCQGQSCVSFAQVGTSATTSYSDTGLTSNTMYSYRVLATDAAGNQSPFSNTTTTTTSVAPPTAPSNVSATVASGTQINLTWTASTSGIGILNYSVERCAGAACSNFAPIATVTTTSYSDTSLTSGVTYSYRVRAFDTNDTPGAYSNTATAITTDTVAPSSPSGLTATAAGTSQINLTWTASTDNVAVTDYPVERCQGSGCSNFTQIATPSSTSYSDTGLTAATSYSYRVRATDAAGNLSGYSNTSNATTQSGPPPGAPALAYGFNEGTGTTTVDGSGNGLTGTLVNGPTWIVGENGNALSFDGTNDKVSLSSSFDISALPFTMEAWVRPSNRTDWHVIFSKRTSYSANGMRVDVGLQQGNGRVYVTTFRTTRTFTYSPPLNTWTHLAITADSSSTKLYVNGTLQQSLGVSTLGTGSTAAVNIGRTGDDQDAFAGGIDDLRVYKRALSQAEIQTDMNAPVVP